MNKTMMENKAQYLILTIFLIQPFIDIYRTFFQGTINIGGLAIEELINLVLVGCLGICVLVELVQKKDKKRGMMLGFYAILCMLYLVLHFINTARFNEALYPASDVSAIRNVYYIARLYGLPMILLCGVIVFPIKKENFIKAVQVYSLIICGTIVLSNITKTSLVTYSLGIDRLAGSIFDWTSLTSESYFEAYTAKGFFYSGNQLSSLLFAMIPFVSYAFLMQANLFNSIVLITQMLAMVMLGTKTAAQGAFIGFGFMFLGAVVLYLIHHIRELRGKDNRINWFYKEGRSKLIKGLFCILLIVGSMGLYRISPCKQRLDHLSYLNTYEQREEKPLEERTREQWIDFINETYWYFYINPLYVQEYPVEMNPDFWIRMVKRDRTLNRDERNFKVQLGKEIMSLNDRSLDSVVGIGYTSNIPYTERDYYFQYFIMGLGGMSLFIAPYFLIVLISLVMILRQFKEKANLYLLACGVGICFYFVVAYIAGHTFYSMYNMLILALYAGMLYNGVKGEKA